MEVGTAKNVRIDVARQFQIFRLAWKIIGEHDLASGHREQDNPVRHLGDLIWRHRRVARGEVHRLVDEILNAGAASFGLIVDGHARGLPAEVLEPRLIDRKWKAGARTNEPQSGRIGVADLCGESERGHNSKDALHRLCFHVSGRLGDMNFSIRRFKDPSSLLVQSGTGIEQVSAPCTAGDASGHDPGIDASLKSAVLQD
jgi:hypothetical protein